MSKSVTSKYTVEVRNKNGNLIQYLTPWIQSLNWEWRRIGGCGNCSFKLAVPYRDIDFNVMDDVQIRTKSDESGIDGYTKLMLHCDGSDGSVSIVDETGKTATVNDGATLDTAQYKFGTASLLLEGASDSVSFADSADWYFGTGDFTVDFWIRFSDITTNHTPIYQIEDGTNFWWIRFAKQTGDGNYKLLVQFQDGGTNKGYFNVDTENYAVNTWYHIAVVRSGTSSLIFVNGTSKELVVTTALSNNDVGDMTGAMCIGGSSGNWTKGWVDEVRISKGVARWTANFTPETKQYGYPSKLIYRGFVSTVSPSLSKTQEISVTCKGYFDLLKTIIVQDTGVEKSYTSDYVYEIVDDIVDTFVAANSDITKGTIDTDAFTVDAIDFKTSVYSALDTLVNLLGNVEYGVDENLVFFWRTESTTVKRKFFVGYDIEKLNRTKDYSDLVNKIYFEGARDDDTGAIYVKTATASGSISSYYLAEAILTNSAISTDTVADAYLTVLLQQKSSPKYKLSFDVPNTDFRMEDTIPLGEVAIYDDEYDRGPATGVTWGTTANGGSNKLWGTTANDGDNTLWGGGEGSYQQQVEYISYELSDTDGRFNIKIYTGGSLDKFAVKVKQLELLTADLRQRG